MTARLWRRTFVAVTTVVFTCTVQPCAAQATREPVDPRLAFPADYPAVHNDGWYNELSVLRASLIRESLAASPDALSTLRLLVDDQRTRQALEALGRIAERHPEDLEQAFRYATPMVFDPIDLAEDPGSLTRLVAAARVNLARLPREDAARAARAVLAFELIKLGGSTADRPARFRAFIGEWKGTEAAESTEVDLLIEGGAANARRLDDLATYAREHARTVAAAKAQFLRAFALARNDVPRNDPLASDPFERFLRVREVVGDLESGTYPPCEWVARARELVVAFAVRGPAQSEEARRTMRAAFLETARADFIFDAGHPAYSGGGFLVSHKLAELYETRDEKIEHVEQLLNEWARDESIGDRARYVLACYLLDLQRGLEAGPELDDLRARARRVLKWLRENGAGRYRQNALATLAVLAQEEHDQHTAIELLTEYVRTYPNSAWMWAAAARLGHAHTIAGDWPAAAEDFRIASQHATNPFSVVLTAAYSGEAEEALGHWDAALDQYRRAVAHWVDYPYYQMLMFEPAEAGANPFIGRRDRSAVVKATLFARTEALARTLPLPGGGLLAAARFQFSHGRRDDAIRTAARVMREHPRTPIAAEARALSRRARVDRALDTGDLKGLEELEREPYDFWTAASKIARAARMWRAGRAGAAEALMKNALDEWHRRQLDGVPAAAPTALEQDIVELRNLTFRPRGDEVFAGSWWELRSLSPPDTPFFVVNPDMDVKLPTGEIRTVSIRRAIPGYPNVLLFDDEQLAFFDRLLAKVGGTERRQPTAIMEVPNQPVGGSMEVLALLQKYFPARPGHWGGWMIASFPTITGVGFTDANLTKARVRVTIGYEGAVLVFEKKDGTWRFKELTGRWIT